LPKPIRSAILGLETAGFWRMSYQGFWAPFVIAASIGVVAAFVVHRRLRFYMGLPGWDFSSSWATNITVFFSVLNIVPLALLPDTEKRIFTVMNFGFLLLPALAPLVYNFSRKIQVSDGKLTSQGRAYMFVVASVLTLWGALGQIELQFLLFDLYGNLGYIPTEFATLFKVVVVFDLIGFGLIIYGLRTIIASICVQPAETKERALSQLGVTQTWPLL
jgi:hypothetical protein